MVAIGQGRIAHFSTSIVVSTSGWCEGVALPAYRLPTQGQPRLVVTRNFADQLRDHAATLGYHDLAARLHQIDQ